MRVGDEFVVEGVTYVAKSRMSYPLERCIDHRGTTCAFYPCKYLRRLNLLFGTAKPPFPCDEECGPLLVAVEKGVRHPVTPWYDQRGDRIR